MLGDALVLVQATRKHEDIMATKEIYDFIQDQLDKTQHGAFTERLREQSGRQIELISQMNAIGREIAQLSQGWDELTETFKKRARQSRDRLAAENRAAAEAAETGEDT